MQVISFTFINKLKQNLIIFSTKIIAYRLLMNLLDNCNDEVVQKSKDNVTDIRTPYATCEVYKKKRSRHQ